MNEPTERALHWADEAAAAVVRAGRHPVISTGISPSGEIHIGNLREVLTADAVYRALKDRGADPHFHYVCDELDPLRRVYPFLDAAVYEPLVGRPLSRIPCPCGAHPSYADHFLEPFLVALRELHIAPELVRADPLYASGRMNPAIVKALDARQRIANILKELTGKESSADWSPFQPLCGTCGRIDRAKLRGYDAAAQTITYECACGGAGTVPMAGGGKLTWRVDWPARWMVLGVTVEPFGKDHATRGGSYDTGVRIAREVFGIEPPFPVPYEWISLKGKGDMSSSKGNVLSIGQALAFAPAEALRYMVLRESPARAIPFDPGLPLLKLLDEMEEEAAPGRDARSLELSRAAGFEPTGVPFRHLVVVAQIAEFDLARTLDVLARSGYRDVPAERVAARLPYIRSWLDEHAPEDLKFRVARELPPEAKTLDADQREFLRRFAARLQDGMTGEEIHAAVYELAPEFPAAGAGKLFEALYVALLGKKKGPRAGWFVELLGPATVAARLRAAAAA
jgi:lysyl-tRNA synthetase class 1